ncbi:MAG: sigma-70 family RNA polymerase sigma factor [Bacteroidota bacterium]
MISRTSYEDTHRALVMGCRRGERKAQYGLYQQYAKGMYNLCLRMLGNAHDAEDVLQVAFVDIFGKIDTFNFESSIGAWIKRVVINRCIDHLKKRRLLTEAFDMNRHADTPETVEPEAYDPGYTVEGVKDAMRSLSDGYRVVLSLYLFEGYDHEEIAKILDITPSTSKSQYHRAKKRLRQLMVA